MAIDAYTGNPRSGKSYSVVKNVILPSLRQGRHVYTNIPLTEKAHSEFPGLIHQLPADWFSNPDLSDSFPAGSVVVLDELWRRWPSGMKVNAFPFKDKEFLAEHGHNVDLNGNTTRVVLVTQDLADIASFARGKVDKTYRAQKLDAVGADNRFRVDIFEGPATGPKPPKTQFIRSVFDKYEPSYYEYYKSSTKSQTGDVGNESRADKRANIWRSPFIIFSIVGPIVVIPFLLWHAVGIFSSGFGANVEPESPSEPVASVETSGPTNPFPAGSQVEQINPAPQAQQVPHELPDSSVWRVSGYIKRGAPGTTGSAGWQSITGYGHPDSEPVKQAAVPDLVVLYSAVYGVRHVVATDCDLYPDGINWHCIIDGTRVAPWTGRGDSTQWAGDSQRLVGRTAALASGATESSSTTNTFVNPQPL